MSRSNNTQTNDQTTEQQMNDSMNQITLIGATIARFDAGIAGPRDERAHADMLNMEETTGEVVAYKGFDRGMECRGFRYSVGQTYEHKGAVEACRSGFHACEHPLHVFNYYPPSVSRFAVVRMSGEICRELSGGDTKLASSKITIDAEIGIPTLVQRAVEWVLARCNPDGEAATGYQGAASATGNQGAASATGYRGAASATGRSSVAVAAGYACRAMAEEGCALFLVNRDDGGEIRHVFAAKVGDHGIKAGTWYALGDDGTPTEVSA